MGKLKSFEEITSWQKAREFNKKIYLATQQGEFKLDFDLARQIRRASVSITSNIAEGFERDTDKQFAQFLRMAKASAGEVRSQLYLALDLEYISAANFKGLKEEITEISKLIGGFINYLQNNNHTTSSS